MARLRTDSTGQMRSKHRWNRTWSQTWSQTLVRWGLWMMVVLGLLMAIWGAAPEAALALDYNRESLVGADFAGKVLTDASFTKANMRESNLSHTDLRGVSFFATNLEAANLEGADLRNATLDAARLSNANLTNALLEGAFAFNAKFDGTIIDGADFTDVEVRDDIRAQLCARAAGTNPTTQRSTRDTLLCP
jgi:uncharacterized protein YjbI with pentapeptide repeats